MRPTTCTPKAPATAPPLAARFEGLSPAQQAAALDLLARLVVTLTPRPRPPHGNFAPPSSPPPQPPYSEGGAR